MKKFLWRCYNVKHPGAVQPNKWTSVLENTWLTRLQYSMAPCGEHGHACMPLLLFPSSDSGSETVMAVWNRLLVTIVFASSLTKTTHLLCFDLGSICSVICSGLTCRRHTAPTLLLLLIQSVASVLYKHQQTQTISYTVSPKGGGTVLFLKVNTKERNRLSCLVRYKRECY